MVIESKIEQCYGKGLSVDDGSWLWTKTVPSSVPFASVCSNYGQFSKFLPS